MSSIVRFRPGTRVLVPWGLDVPRSGTIVEVWGDAVSPTQIRVRLDQLDDDEPAVLLLDPKVVHTAA